METRQPMLMSQLPTVVRDGKTWYVDSRLRQARNVANPHDFRDFDTDDQLTAFSSVTHRFVGTADQLEAHYDARELVGQPCWIESVESEHEETGVKYVIRFETGDAVAHADDLTSLLEELAVLSLNLLSLLGVKQSSPSTAQP